MNSPRRATWVDAVQKIKTNSIFGWLLLKMTQVLSAGGCRWEGWTPVWSILRVPPVGVGSPQMDVKCDYCLHRFNTSIRSGSNSRLQSFKIQTCKSTLIMQLFWLFFQPHFFKTRSRLPPPYHFFTRSSAWAHHMKNDICISPCWGGVGYHSCLHRLLHSFLSVTHFCCSTFIWKGRISLSLSSWLMLHIHSFTRAHTWELWHAHTHSPELIF